MKLNLWMIANRLSELEPELHIPENAPAALQSARRAYATECVYIYQKGRNVICDAGTRGGGILSFVIWNATRFLKWSSLPLIFTGNGRRCCLMRPISWIIRK